MPKLGLQDIDLQGRRVLVRVDFNVPLDAEGGVADDMRIRAALPTIEHLLKNEARVILCGHLGRPNGKPDPALSLRPVALKLSELLSRPVAFVDEGILDKTQKTISTLQNGECLLLENLRFFPQEEANDPEFARCLAAHADLFVNDAFGVAHRAHASTEGVAQFLQPAVAGFLIQRELKFLGEGMENPHRPFAAILGGAKVSNKIKVVESLLEKADMLIIGGAMAYTFLKSCGTAVGASFVEEDQMETARKTMDAAFEERKSLVLPMDHVVARRVETDQLDKNGRKIVEFQDIKNTTSDSIPDGFCGVDIGPQTVKAYRSCILKSETIFWNGPMGIFENESFSKGTFEIARAVAESGSRSMVGGTDSIKAIRASGLAERITFLSTGGGASLKFLEGKTLPGVAALTEK